METAEKETIPPPKYPLNVEFVEWREAKINSKETYQDAVMELMHDNPGLLKSEGLLTYLLFKMSEMKNEIKDLKILIGEKLSATPEAPKAL